MHPDDIRVVIAEDHAGVRRGLCAMVEREDDIRVIGEARDGGEALEIVKELLPDVILLDVELPLKRGQEVARAIQREDLAVKVLAISSYDDRETVRSMKSAGAVGFVAKDRAHRILIDSIRTAAEGTSAWIGESPAGSGRIATRPTQETLSLREHRVIEALAAGQSEEEAAASLGMPPATFSAYLALLRKKFGVGRGESLEEAVRLEDPS